MNYAECQRYLQEVLGSGVKFGLNNVRAVLAALRNPHLAYPSILVAGTNGKGSVCAMLAEILSRHGFRIGLYTSPHLVHVEERIRVGGSPIPRRDFCRLLSRLKGLIPGLVASGKLESPPTYFEVLTILGLQYFCERKVDLAVLEVGMGGRLDATNVVTPLVSVITTVGRDHQEFLGRTLAEIAFEKAGIIKPGVPLICGRVPRMARKVINRKAREMGSPVRGVLDEPGDLSARRLKDGFRFSLRFAGEEFVFQPKLPGEHQGRNAALAIAAGWELSRSWRRLSKRRIIQGIREADWPGRLEVISRRPLVVLDGAHNEAGARVAAAYAREFLPRPLTLVFGIMRDKSIRRVSAELFPLADNIFLTSLPMPRAASPELVYSLAPVRKKLAFLEPDPKKAVQKAIEMTPRNGSVLITGSLYLVGEIKKLLQPKRKLAPK
jgi:dihydrofolate synthase/folylpolyglutamate synthase